MANDWAFATLNELTPLFNNSPENGPSSSLERDPFSLSYPIDSAALANSLEQWSSLPFDLSTDFDYSLPTPALPLFDSATPAATTTAKPATKKRSHAVALPENALASTSALSATTTDDSANAAAIEEDKRKRNTAASARFRIKKKQREAALESTAKDLSDKVASLKSQVTALRTENGWLRGLIVDQTTKKESESRASALDSVLGYEQGAIDPSLHA